MLCISTCTRPMAVKHDKVVIHYEGCPTITSHNPLYICLQEVTWQIKNIISPLSHVYGQETYNGGEVLQEASTYRFAWPLNEVFMWGHMTNYINHICRRPMGTKIGKVLTYSKRLLSLNSHDSLITWPKSSHATIWKFYISLIIKFMASKRGRMLTYERRFSMQTLKSLSTCCSPCPSCRCFWMGWQNIFVSVSSIFTQEVCD